MPDKFMKSMYARYMQYVWECRNLQNREESHCRKNQENLGFIDQSLAPVYRLIKKGYCFGFCFCFVFLGGGQFFQLQWFLLPFSGICFYSILFIGQSIDFFFPVKSQKTGCTHTKFLKVLKTFPHCWSTYLSNNIGFTRTSPTNLSIRRTVVFLQWVDGPKLNQGIVSSIVHIRRAFILNCYQY